MAKKVVATLQKKESKNMARVIKAVRNEKTGTYTFREEMVTVDKVNDVLNS